MRHTGFSIIMPTYNQAAFIRRAIASLQRQTYSEWELIIVNDGSTDDTELYISDYLQSLKIIYIRNEENTGLGHAVNQALEQANYEYIAYLPSDDYYDDTHLETLKAKLDESTDIVLAFSGVRYDASEAPGILAYQSTYGIRMDYNLLMVQTAHRNTSDRWTEREECVSEDLFFTFWRKLTDKGIFVPTKQVTCEWTNHPNQRHKITGEQYGGGLNKYRQYYQVKHPIRFRTTHYKTISEPEIYAPYRKEILPCKDSLKILLVGELAYNPERMYAFEEAGHQLYGLWAKPRFCYSTVSPLPFGHIKDIPYECWQERICEIRPDIIYAQLSTGAIDIAYEVLKANMGIPFVWHFKEGPHEAMKAGLWDKLIDLYTYADGRIYLNDVIKDWFQLFIPNYVKSVPTYVLDGDLPKADCFYSGTFAEKLSATDGAVHTVVTGRMIGLSPGELRALADANIHVHVYNENYISDSLVMSKFHKAAPDHFHIHNHCSQLQWVNEFSKYDAGWLHSYDSFNEKNLLRANWSDLNLPARINTLAAAGIPMILKLNENHVTAMREYVGKRGMGIFYNTIHELISQLKNRSVISQTEHNVRSHRMEFTFDYHVPDLICFFREVIETVNRNRK